jgi:hypothetical protein
MRLDQRFQQSTAMVCLLKDFASCRSLNGIAACSVLPVDQVTGQPARRQRRAGIRGPSADALPS